MIHRLHHIGFRSLTVAALLASSPHGDLAAQGAVPDHAAAISEAHDHWEWGLGIHGWAPSLDAQLGNAVDLKLGFGDIVSDLQAVAMLAVAAEKGPWTIGCDLVYLDIGKSASASGSSDPILGNFTISGSARVDADVQAWIATPVVAHQVCDESWGSTTVFVGARYLHLRDEVGIGVTGSLELNGNPLLSGSGYYKTRDSRDSWAGLIGLAGRINLRGSCYIPYYVDVGTGDPDLTWQAFTGIGRSYGGFDLICGYRHMEFQFTSHSGQGNLEISGPMIGLQFSF